MKNLLVAQSGGPTSAINATLAGVVENALSSPSVDRIYGSINGIQGVLTENLIDLKTKLTNDYSITLQKMYDFYSKLKQLVLQLFYEEDK